MTLILLIHSSDDNRLINFHFADLAFLGHIWPMAISSEFKQILI